MSITLNRTGAALAATCVLVATAAGCGSNTLNTGGATTASATGSGSGTASANGSASASAVTIPSVSADASLAAKVPAAIKAKGTLQDASDGSYAPNEFYPVGSKVEQGMDIDLLNAVAAKLGLKVKVNDASFASIIGGVGSGKFDIGVSSFTITKERLGEVNMVKYFTAGTSWAAASAGAVDPNNACGKTIAVQTGTTQVDDLTARSKKCTAAGKSAIKLVSEDLQTRVAADVMAGKADAMAADSPVTAYAIKQSNGGLVAIGSAYDTAPYGLVVGKGQTVLAQLISQALTSLKADGTYEKILEKWGVQDGAVSDFPVDPSVAS